MLFFNNPLHKLSAIPLLCGFCLSGLSQAQQPPHTVADLAYGQSLYHLFQDKKLQAITDITVAKQRQQLNNRPQDAELLLGSLYFDYGLADDSEQVLSTLLEAKTDPQTSNRIWFNLARVQYQQKNYQQAEKLLLRINQNLPAAREDQKNYMLSKLYTSSQQLDQAAAQADKIKPQSDWSAFAQYNLGIALENNGQNQQGQQWLSKLISRTTENPELLALQDAARLILGLNALRNNQLEKSIQYLGKITLDSVYTNRALLATGWAWSRLSHPRKALTYWLNLQDRNQQDGATQEAYLAIAHAQEQLENKPLATRYYEQSLHKYDESINEIEALMQRITDMELINSLYSDNTIKPELQDTIEQSLPQQLASSYLIKLFASDVFQQSLTNYRELLQIHNTLIHWKTNLPTLQLMLVERINSFEDKRDLLAQTTDLQQIEVLQQRRNKLAREVKRIEQKQDYYALANEQELDYLQQLETLKALFEKLQSRHDLTLEKQKFRIMSGLLKWNISTDYPRRYWKILHQLQLLDRALTDSRESALSLQQASSENALNLNTFSQRIEGQNNAIQLLEINASQLIDQQEQHINLLALDVLEKQLNHLQQLKLSARYSLTRLYDELSKSGGVQ